MTGRPQNILHRIIEYDAETKKGLCSRCGPTDVRIRSYKGGGPFVYCWFKRVEERYHITRQQYEELLELQDGICAICEGDLTNWHFDHDHKTDTIRGILCNSCNRGIGYLKDSPKILRRAAKYLERPPIFQTARAKFYKDKRTLRYVSTGRTR